MNYELRIMETEDKKQKIKNFTDLNVWKEGHKLVLEIYGLIKMSKTIIRNS